jgi:[ribosomal protein S5]-alanine N-acetyltransferase
VASSGRPLELSAHGARVHVRTVRPEDDAPYRRAVLASAERMRRWNPVNPDDLVRHIAQQSADHRTFFVFANEPDPEQPMVGRINLNGVVRGRFRSVAMGYDAYDPYAGRGLFGEGLRLVVNVALAAFEDGGMDLHRVEANVQPGNSRSAGLLRSLGFHHEGFSPRLLFLPDDNGSEQWRDHERYAVTREDWPAAAYAPADPPRLVVLLDTTGTAVGWEHARAVAGELALPLFPAELVRQVDLAGLVADCPLGAVVAGPLSSPEFDQTLAVLHAAFPEAVRSAGAGVPEWDARSVTNVALVLRAAGRTGR